MGILGRLTGKKKSASSGSNKAISALVSPSGRVKLDLLRDKVASMTRKEFMAYIDAPLLVGSSVYGGDLREYASDQRGIASKTVQFSRNRLIEEMESDAIKHAIYPLIKSESAKNQGPAFQVGRLAGKNDIVITDVSVSKKHATISSFGTAGQIMDLGSTNGTTVNGRKLKPKERVRLKDGDTVSIGRYEFKFLLPGALYELLE